MWQCVNCKTEVENKYSHCWQCGTKHISQPGPQQQTAVPAFASYEELAKVPKESPWVLRRGLLQRLFWLLLIMAILKVVESRFLGAYGNHIVGGVGVCALIVILWRSFRRDPTEGVGIKLH